MKKPIKPTKQIWIDSFCSIDDELTLEEFYVWCKNKTVNGRNAMIKVRNEYDFDMDGEINYAKPLIELSWEELIDNPQYDHEMKKYEAKMRKWKKQNE